MRFEDLRRLEERFEGAANDVQRLAASLSRDIRDNPSISAAEMKFKVQTMLSAQAPVNQMAAMTAEMAYRLALQTEPIDDDAFKDIAPPETSVGDEAGEGKSGIVVNGKIVVTGTAAGQTPPERDAHGEAEG